MAAWQRGSTGSNGSVAAWQRGHTPPDWMRVDGDKLTTTINRMPEREEIQCS